MNFTQSSASITMSVVAGTVGMFSIVSPLEIPSLGGIEDYSDVSVYSEGLYRTSYDNPLVKTGYTEAEKLALLSDFANEFSNKDVYLSHEESQVISDDLFDLM